MTRRTPGEHCKRCDRDVVIGFKVSDAVWNNVVGDPGTVLCAPCFDEAAHEKRIPYIFKSLHPCPWQVWGEPSEDHIRDQDA